VKQGSYLLVESLDRISRQTARKALRTLEDIVESGVTLVTLTDGKAYTADSLDQDQMSLMWALMVSIRAHEESSMKGRRMRAAWEGKRAKAVSEGKPITATCPGWLALDC
jgi:DNA invertase Pin-like site-specific DNA recombinase